MPLPLKVLNRLRLGRDVAARIPPSQPVYLAWVYVYPIPDKENGLLIEGTGDEARIVQNGVGNPIKGFLIRHLEIDREVAEAYHLERRDEIGNPPIDERVEVSDEEELEAILRNWMSDFTAFHIPRDVGYEFESGVALMREMTDKEPVSDEAFLELIGEFLDRRIEPETFCAQFTKFWMRNRDAASAKRFTWPERYDLKLIDALKRGDITRAEFSEKWRDLWGYAEIERFLYMVDAIHSACSCYNPDPELDGEIDEARLRQDVAMELATYKSDTPLP